MFFSIISAAPALTFKLQPRLAASVRIEKGREAGEGPKRRILSARGLRGGKKGRMAIIPSTLFSGGVNLKHICDMDIMHINNIYIYAAIMSTYFSQSRDSVISECQVLRIPDDRSIISSFTSQFLR
jgi:hypothetical protein